MALTGINHIFNRLILVAGPPRSGTTFAARSLNHHPQIVTAIDDHVHECWALYYYRTRAGLVQRLQTQAQRGEISQKEVEAVLKEHLFADGCFKGIAPSAKTSDCPLSSPPVPPDSAATPGDLKLIRHTFPVGRFKKDWYLCLKSPEVSYVLPQLATIFPRAKFVLVYRPIVEIAESMFRKGETIKRFPVFHQRWQREIDEKGVHVPPPGVPAEWTRLWQTASGFHRCVMNAAGYIKAVQEGLAIIPRERFFLYNHAQMRKQPDQVFAGLAEFLGIDADGFKLAIAELKQAEPHIEPGFQKEYEKIQSQLNLNKTAPLTVGSNDLPQDPIFIVGYPRSGTTLLQALLAAQERVYSLPETHFFNVINRKLKIGEKGVIESDCLEGVFQLIREKIDLEFSSLEIEVITLKAKTKTLRPKMLFESVVFHYLRKQSKNSGFPGSFRWLEKTPNHAYFLEDILAMYPRAQFVNIVRNPAAAINSRKNHFPYNKETPIDELAQMWLRSITAVEEFNRKHPGKIYSLRYEDLVKGTGKEMAKLGKFLNITIRPDLLAKYKNIGRHIIHNWETWKSSIMSGEIYNNNDTYKQELSGVDLLHILDKLGQKMKQYGYILEKCLNQPYP